MRLIKAIDKQSSGAPTQAKFAYLFRADDITYWFPPDAGGVKLNYAPRIIKDAFVYRLYITPKSQEFSYDTVGDPDSGGFITKFSGTHPGCMLSALEFSKNFLHQGFIVMIPQCDDMTIVLGTPENPLVFSSSHKSGSDGRKFTFNFAQEIDSEEIYMLGDFKPWEDSKFRFFDKYFNKKFD